MGYPTPHWSLVQLNPADTTPNAPPVGPNLHDFLVCDTTGLDDLANRMRAFVATRGNPTVASITQQVDTIVQLDDDPAGGWTPGSPGWMGIGAYSFYQTFISNAATMNGFHHVICEAANLLQTFAAKICDLESQLESKLQPAGQSLYPPFDLAMVEVWVGTSAGEYYLAMKPETGGKMAAQLQMALNEIYTEYEAKANAERHTTAASLIALSELLNQAVTFYSTGSAVQSSNNQGILVEPAQTKVLSGLSGDFGSSLHRATSSTNLSGGGKAAATKALSDVGLASGAIANLLKAYQGISSAGTAAGGASAALQDIGTSLPVLAEIGLSL
jgi:hypothetical protein